MFNSVTEKFRSYIFSANTEGNLASSSRKRKRQFEETEVEDSDVEIISVKRPKQGVSSSVFNFFSFPVNKMTDWFKQRGSSFSKDFFFKTLEEHSTCSRPPVKTHRRSIPTTNGRTTTSDGIRKSVINSRQKVPIVQTKRSYRDVVASSCINPSQTNGYSSDENMLNHKKKPFSLLSSGNRNSNYDDNQSTAQLCVRLDEKEKYRQLIQQFTSVPINTTKQSNKLFPKTSIFTPSSTLNTSSNSTFENKSSTNVSSLHENKRSKPHVTPALIDPLDVSSKYLRKHHKSAVELLASAPSLPILDTSTSIHIPDETFTETETGEEKMKSPNVRWKSFGECSSQAFDKLEQSLYMKDNWLREFKSTSDLDKEERLRKISEAEIIVDYRHKWRQKKDAAHEKNLHEQMKALEPFTEEVIEVEDEDNSKETVPELTSEMNEVINRALRLGPAQEILVEGYKLQILRQDILTLKDLNWLNDEVINFYMNMLMERGEQDNMPSIHSFNTFFYPKLMSAGHSAVRRWTKKVDVLAVDYILIPVHLGMHWCLAIIDFKKKCVKYFDSMGGNNNKCLNALRQYLCDESLDKKKQAFDLSGWTTLTVKNVPQQMNGSDCGMFACKYAEYITREAEITFSQEDMPYFRRRMVYEITKKKLLQ